jgi:hypothetical protein
MTVVQKEVVQNETTGKLRRRMRCKKVPSLLRSGNLTMSIPRSLREGHLLVREWQAVVELVEK